MRKLCLVIVFLILTISANNKTLPPQSYKEVEETVVLDHSSTDIVNDLVYLHPAFRNKVLMLIIECHRQGIELKVNETWRSRALQNYYRSKGSRVTTLEGGKSRHQYGLAVDVVPYINGKLAWNRKTLSKVGKIGESLGLGWGGKWRRPYDPCHFEWKITTEELLTGILPDKPDTLLIPI